ncbi:MAG: hypothetical protein WC460_01275 [Patescibacteria group bacterium]
MAKEKTEGKSSGKEKRKIEVILIGRQGEARMYKVKSKPVIKIGPHEIEDPATKKLADRVL